MVDPLEGYVYLGSVGGEVIVVKDMQEVARYDLKGGVAAMAPDPRTGEVYVMAPGPDNYDLYRFRRGKLVDKIDAEDATVGGTVQSLQVHPTTGDVYLVDYALKEVIIVRDMAVIERLPVDWQPQAITIDPLTGNVYVPGFRFDTVTVIQGTEVLTTIPVGWKPYALDVNPANGRVYVANIAENSVTILGFEE